MSLLELSMKSANRLGRAIVLVGLLALACRREQAAARRSLPSATSSAHAETPPALRFLRAEHDRDSSGVAPAAMTAAAPELRLAAVRSLARIADDGARSRLLEALSDEDSEVVRWAAFGLGHVCKGDDSTVRALVIRAAGLSALAREPADAALSAIARALGRCTNDEAERSLRAWLGAGPPLSEAAALALGTLAMRRGKLDDASWAALLDAAARKDSPLDSALFAFGRVTAPDGPLRQRSLELAVRALPGKERPRRFALRALGRAGSLAVPPLRAFAERDDISALERAEAFREISRIGGADAQHALAELLPARMAVLGPRLLDPAQAGELGALLTLLDALTDARARPVLERLARLELPAAEPARRHAIALRCAAARLLADKSSLKADLVACDPDPQGRVGKLALLRVLDRGELTGERAKRHQALTEDADPVVRQKALELLADHPEAAGVVPILLRALADSSAGTVATAAEFLASHPSRAQSDPKLLELLATSFRLQQKRPNLEVRAALIDAAAALGVLALKPEIARDCSSDSPELRNHAERALRAFGERGRRCQRAPEPSRAPEELERLVRGTKRLKFDTDAGELWLDLDAGAAPVAVTRMVELAASGFFDGMAVHRVVSGFVVQFGDPGEDGYGGVERRALRSELSPDPFEPGSVGVALSGPDTGSSQLFVTLGTYPHLDGEYSRIGSAGPGWERLIQGDRLRRVRPVP
jgi:cyclophilin family peptidyl-prolyl cis-trans isomerase